MRHHRIGLHCHPGPDRKRYKGDPAPTQVQQGNTTQSTEPWAAQKPYLAGGMAGMMGPNGQIIDTAIPGIFQLANQQYNGANPQYFPGSTVTGFQPNQIAAQNQIAGIANQGNPAVTNAYNTAAAYAGGDFSNPGIQGAIEAARRSVQPAVDSRFNMAGRSFSPAHAGTLGKGIAGATAPLIFGAQQAAMANAPALAAARYADPQALAGVGAEQQVQGQTELNAAIDRHNFEQNRESNKLAQYLQMIQGNYGGTSTGLSTGTQTVSGGKGTQQAIGNALKLGGGIAMSDRRLKRDIKRVGILDNGIPVYLFRYRDSPVVHMGVMADEVEKVIPEAVIDVNGYKAVRYGML